MHHRIGPRQITCRNKTTIAHSRVPHTCHAQRKTGDSCGQHASFKSTTNALLNRHFPSVWTCSTISVAELPKLALTVSVV